MRQSLSYLAIAVMAIPYRPAVSTAEVFQLPGRLKTKTLAPIETLVDWLESIYGGPIDAGNPPA